MNSELMRYATGEVKPRPQDRAVTARAKAIYDEVREADFLARGIIALTADVMEGVAELDEHRKRLAKGDPALNAALSHMEVNAIQQVSDIVSSVHRPVKRLSW